MLIINNFTHYHLEDRGGILAKNDGEMLGTTRELFILFDVVTFLRPMQCWQPKSNDLKLVK
jgi:hypothetical protein